MLVLLMPAKADDWTKNEVVLESSYQILLLADWRQTSNFHRYEYGDVFTGTHSIGEKNMFLGRKPNQATINIFCLVSSIGHLLVSRAMDHKERVFWQSATILIEVSAVTGNYSAGVRITF